MSRQIYTAPTVTATLDAKQRPHPQPDITRHTQFLPGDRATQILLQQFL